MCWNYIKIRQLYLNVDFRARYSPTTVKSSKNVYNNLLYIEDENSKDFNIRYSLVKICLQVNSNKYNYNHLYQIQLCAITFEQSNINLPYG